MILDFFRRKHTRAELETALQAFDAQTQVHEGRIVTLRAFIADGLAQEAVAGELDKEGAAELKRSRAELPDLLASQEARPRARARIAQALTAAEQEEAREARRAKLVEARAWSARMSTATDALVSTLRAVTEKIDAMRQIDSEIPAFVTRERPNVAPAAGGWLARFRFYVEPDAFGPAIGILEKQKAILAQTLQDIEAGAITAHEHLAERQKMDTAPRAAS